MSIYQSRYRQLDFIGARILQARELNWLQEIAQGVALEAQGGGAQIDGQLQAQFVQGALYNITPTIIGLTVTLSATNGAQPMMIFVRDRWEIFPGQNDDCTDTPNGIRTGNASMTLTGAETAIYLNWELIIRTYTDDPTLIDSSGAPAAEAGELVLHLSDVDTSGAALTASQLAKNTSPIPILTFTNSGVALTLVPTDNIQTQALATEIHSGFVSTTTSNPIVVSTDDPRIGAAITSVADGLVHDSTVRTPIPPGGVNADGTPVYNLTGDIGGISAAKIVLTATTQLVSDAYAWLKTQFLSLQSAFNSHYTAALGLMNTHPIPTAAQVGAAPASHVGQPFGLVTSHPPVANLNSGGFSVNQTTTGSANDPAYQVYSQDIATNIASLNHDGDVYSKKSSTYIATPGGTLPPSPASGSLGLSSVVAGVLSQHVNQTSHCNPHGLTASDLGIVASINPPHRVVLSSPISMIANTQTIILSLTVTFPAAPGIYRADIRYGMWAKVGANIVEAQVVDVTNNLAFAFSGQNSNGEGYTGLAAAEISNNTYNAGAVVTFKLEARTNSGAVVDVYGYTGLLPQIPTYLSIAPILSN